MGDKNLFASFKVLVRVRIRVIKSLDPDPIFFLPINLSDKKSSDSHQSFASRLLIGEHPPSKSIKYFFFADGPGASEETGQTENYREEDVPQDEKSKLAHVDGEGNHQVRTAVFSMRIRIQLLFKCGSGPNFMKSFL